MPPLQAFFFGALCGIALTIVSMLVVMRMERRHRSENEWEPTRWWRVIDTFDDSVWCETSDEDEARHEMRSASDRLERLYESTEQQWRTEPHDDAQRRMAP